MSLRRSIQAPPDAPFKIDLGPAHFFLDEIRDVHDALLDFSKDYTAEQKSTEGPGNVEIRAGSAAADYVEDLKEATSDELAHVTLILSAPKIRVNLSRRDAGIIAESENARVASFAESIAGFVDSRRSRRAPIRVSWILAIAPYWLGVICSYFAPYTPKSWGLYTTQGLGRYNLVASVFATLIGLGFIGFFYSLSRSTIIITPLWRKEQRGLSHEMRTALIAAIISAVVLGAFGFWAGVLVNR